MTARGEQRNRNEAFGRLLSGAINSIATYEGKTAPAIEEELGALALVSGKTIQRYKAGYLPPEQRTVEILAEAAVTRGFLGRAWLQRFLHAARYPGADQLLNRLCPAPIVRARAPRVYANLPAPTYSQFVMRQQAFAEVLEGLAARSAAVLIVGLGGQGKTSLAREVADACLRGVEGAPAFDAAVWVSDKDRPGTTNLSVVLDEIARTLDYPGFTQFEHNEKHREVEQLLRRQRVLLVVDNFETVTDGALLSWLLRLPEPSKALITSREYQREYRRSSWPVELRGMSEAEAQTLIAQRLRMLQLDKKVKDAAEFEPLVAVTGGNPKAIEIALGVVKHERRPLQQVVDDLYAARGELFDDLFARAWSLLDEAARRVLMVMTFFPDSASGEAVAASADVQGYAFERAVERLTDLALLDIQQAALSTAPRYTLHPLVRAFAGARLGEQPSFEQGARERWIEYFYRQVLMRGTIGIETEFDLTDFEEDVDTIHAVINYYEATQRAQALIKMVSITNQFWSIRGYYADRKSFSKKALSAAERIADVPAQISLLSTRIRTFCYEDNIEDAAKCLVQARELLQTLEEPSNELILSVNYAEIRVSKIKQDYQRMRTLVEQNLFLSQKHRSRMFYSFDMAYYLCLTQQYVEAKELLRTVIPTSFELGMRRGPIRGWLMLGKIGVAEENTDEAARHLAVAQEHAQQLGHQRHIAEILLVWGQLHLLLKNVTASRTALTQASDIFERLGMRRELAEARAELARLGPAPVAPASGS